MNSGGVEATLRDACAAWQDGRDGGSSPIRAAARVLTGTKHYFAADFIARHEREAAQNEKTLSRARALLEDLASRPALDAAEWGRVTGVDSSWAGRGIKSDEQDGQILESLAGGTISMPLWGLTLDRDVAASFSRGFHGRGFVFELVGPFPAIPAWEVSAGKAHERELITGGRYEVLGVENSASEGPRVVRLRFIEPVRTT